MTLALLAAPTGVPVGAACFAAPAVGGGADGMPA